jgi:hypothetical protein
MDANAEKLVPLQGTTAEKILAFATARPTAC